MTRALSEDAQAVCELSGEPPTELLEEMERYGREQSFPIVGPEVGRLLRQFASLVDATRVFEFGSGFGYSAAWFATVLPADGELVLTDHDAENLETAREFLARGEPLTPTYESGDALETIEEYDGPFDVVLIDHEKARYVEALEAVREKLADEAVVVADNMLAGPVEPADVRAGLEGEGSLDERTRGVRDYLETVRDDPEFDSSVIPLGEGIAVSRLR